MNTAQMWWYMEELKRKTRSLESERERVTYWLERAQDERPNVGSSANWRTSAIAWASFKRGLLF